VTLGTVAAVLEIVPYVGGAVTVILASLLALSVGIPQTIAVIVIYTVLVNIESHVLAPVLFGHAVGLPSVAILLALLAGIELLGIVGAFLAVPATVIIWGIVEEVWPSSAKRQRGTPYWLRAARGAHGRVRRNPAVKPLD
jgi:predicted PurR-regulated permease PerM